MARVTKSGNRISSPNNKANSISSSKNNFEPATQKTSNSNPAKFVWTTKRLLEYIQENNEDVSGAITQIENNITNIENSITTIEGDVSTIEGDITTIEGDITTIEGDITTINTALENIIPAILGKNVRVLVDPDLFDDTYIDESAYVFTDLQLAINDLVDKGYDGDSFDNGIILINTQILGVTNYSIPKPFGLVLENLTGYIATFGTFTLNSGADPTNEYEKCSLITKGRGNSFLQDVAFTCGSLVFDNNNYAGAETIRNMVSLDNTQLSGSIIESNQGIASDTENSIILRNSIASGIGCATNGILEEATNSIIKNDIEVYDFDYSSNEEILFDNFNLGGDLTLSSSTVTANPIRLLNFSMNYNSNFSRGASVTLNCDSTSRNNILRNVNLTNITVSLFRNDDFNFIINIDNEANIKNPEDGMIANVNDAELKFRTAGSWGAIGGDSPFILGKNTRIIMDTEDMPAGLVDSPYVFENDATALQDAITDLVNAGYTDGFDKGQILVYAKYNQPTENVTISRPFDLTILNMTGYELVMDVLTLKCASGEASYNGTFALRLGGNNNITTRTTNNNGDKEEFLAFSIYDIIVDYDNTNPPSSVKYILNLNDTLVRRNVQEINVPGTTTNLSAEFSSKNCMYYSLFTLQQIFELHTIIDCFFNAGGYWKSFYQNSQQYLHIENCTFQEFSSTCLRFRQPTTINPLRIKFSRIVDGGNLTSDSGIVTVRLDGYSWTNFSANAIVSNITLTRWTNFDDAELIYYTTNTGTIRNPYTGMQVNHNGIVKRYDGSGWVTVPIYTSGAGAPSGGNPGDIYTDTSSGDVYINAEGSWVLIYEAP